uniref:Uncharacterized protein n=1 Tax=Astatotilapia calliptera TaxID=8154 RepID=A0A3P8NT93_ASTCA
MPSPVCQHQKEIRIAHKKGKGQSGGRREERVITAAYTEHRDRHLICISQWLVSLPVAFPVLGWVSEKCFLKVPEGRRAEGPIHIPDASEGTRISYKENQQKKDIISMLHLCLCYNTFTVLTF